MPRIGGIYTQPMSPNMLFPDIAKNKIYPEVDSYDRSQFLQGRNFDQVYTKKNEDIGKYK